MTTGTTTLSYWLNWRVLLCAIWVLASLVIASFLIWKYEGTNYSKYKRRDTQQDGNETWKPCLSEVHPSWLLAFRIFAFCFLLSMLTADVVVYGVLMFNYYTQWTFTLVTIYFGLGSLLSIYGWYQYHKSVKDFNVDTMSLDAEQESYVSLTYDHPTNTLPPAGIWSYAFQVIFQLTISLHSVNAIFLLGDTVLNSLRFPWFRISYFFLWTGIFVIFQWIIHASISIGWPYPFLDLSSPSAPFWYLLISLLHIPCYGIFALIVEMKHYLLSRWFPHSYQCSS